MNILIIIYLLSRLLLLNTQPVFFDSPEYIKLLADPNFFHALALGHFPPHVGYVLFSWPVFHIFGSITAVLVAQSILSLAALIAFIKIIKHISGSFRVAFLSGLIASLLPVFWVSNVTLMMEISYVSLYIFAIFFLLNEKLFLSVLFLALSLITHPLVLFWLPLYFYFIFIYQKSELKRYILSFLSIYSLCVFLNILNISFVQHASFTYVIKMLYLSKFGEHAALSFNLTSLLVAVRNLLIPLAFNNSILLVVLASFSLLKNRKYFWLGLLWIGPAFFANQWWDSLLSGRHALLASFGLAFLAASLLSNYQLLTTIFITYLIYFSIPAVYLIKQPIPYLQLANASARLPAASLFIISHFAKPQIENNYSGKLLAVNDPITSSVDIQRTIDNYLVSSRPVFVTSDAFSEPYGLYSGPYLHNLTLSYLHPYELQKIWKNYSLKDYQVISRSDNIIIYQIVSSTPSAYPKVPHLGSSSRLINSHDILFNIVTQLVPSR